ncbi:MAG: LamG domain-containing protein, partial [Candidatus Poribacteria bacterium]|nr:LamG domain-containing protein [Candidatus Poribacteria bacterium]
MFRKMTVMAMAAVLLLTLSATDAVAVPEKAKAVLTTVFASPFGASTASYTYGYGYHVPGNQQPDLRTLFYDDAPTVNLNNNLYFVTLSGGMAVQLYADINFGGASRTLTAAGEHNLASLNNFGGVASSVKFWNPVPVIDATVSNPPNLANALLYQHNFGDVYMPTLQGAPPISVTFTLGNVIGWNSSLAPDMIWEMAGVSPGLSFNVASGTIDANTTTPLAITNGTQITATYTPAGPGPFDVTFLIATNSSAFPGGEGDYRFRMTGNVHDFQSVFIQPSVGQNGAVNIAADAPASDPHRTISVESWLKHPSATINDYQWQQQPRSVAAPTGAWVSGTKSWLFDPSNGPGDYRVFVRAKTNHNVYTDPLNIPVTVWERPAILDTPLTVPANQWFADDAQVAARYYSQVGTPIPLSAASSSGNPDLTYASHTQSSKYGNGALNPNGTTAYPLDTIDAINRFTPARTVSLWFRTANVNQNAVLFEEGGGSNGLSIYLDGGLLRAGAWTNDIPFGWHSLSGVTANIWHHVAFTLGESSPGNFVTNLWLNGVASGAIPGASPILTHGGTNGYAGYVTSTRTHTGSLSSSSGLRFTGSLDELALFSRMLSSSEIVATANSSAGSMDWDANGMIYLDKFEFPGAAFEQNVASQYIWYQVQGNRGSTIGTQNAGAPLNHSFPTATTSGKLYVYGISRLGMRTVEKAFNLRIYPQITVTANDVTGRPLSSTTLNGSTNSSQFSSGGSSVSYTWKVDSNGDGVINATVVEDVSQLSSFYEWGIDGDYPIELTMSVGTFEGAVYTKSDTATAQIASGRPTADAGGPYRGGITGGNDTPIRLLGNTSNPVPSVDIGSLVEWDWTRGPTHEGIALNGSSHFATTYNGILGTAARSVVAWVKTSQSSNAIVSWGSGATGGKWDMRMTNLGLLYLQTGGGSVWGGPRIDNGAWHHVAIVLPEVASPTTSDIVFYIDGVRYDSSVLEETHEIINTA